MHHSHNPTEVGRNALKAWKASQPRSFFQQDRALQGAVARHLGAERYAALLPDLEAEGAAVAELEPKVEQLEHRSALPRLERYDGIGNRTESIAFDGTYHQVGKVLYGTGVVSRLRDRGVALETAALLYMNNQLGEAGHNCPIVCTMGAVRAIQEAGDPDLKERFLPGLLTREYGKHLHAAQFMTEVQGGSDVGLNGVRALPNGNSGQLYAIVGEKWFCSNANADLFLMTARPDGAASGTAGLGLFLVPRIAPWGALNEFTIRRLKEKLGTRAMASGEMDFTGAAGWSIGPVEHGFKTMMNHVINTSRLYNASGCLGMSRRALTVASTYAQHRVAFGQPIARYPLVQESLADMRAEHEVLLHGHLHLAALRDRIDLGLASEEELGFFRVALNLNKFRTSVSAGEVIRTAIELLGGNGAIESFSPLPRLLRDNVVYENWEGTHNTLYMQVLRDMARLDVGRAFLGELARRFQAVGSERGAAAVQELGAALRRLSDASPGLQSLAMRPLAHRMSSVMALCAALEQAAHEGDPRTAALAEHFAARHLGRPLSLPTDADLGRLQALAEDE